MLKVLTTLLALYALVLVFSGCIADRAILHPPQGRLLAGRAQSIAVESPRGRKIEVWTARSPAAATEDDVEAYVLEFCGNATRAEQIAQFVADRWHRYPVEVWVMNYPGYGASEGRPRLDDIPPAALATYDALKQRADGQPIFLCGNSLGTTSALFVASRRPTAGLILQNPPPLRRLMLGRYAWWNLGLLAVPIALQVPGEMNSTDTAPRVTAPAVFLTAGRDEVVPPKYQRYVIDAFGGAKRVIEMSDATHGASLKGDAERQLQEAMKWLWERRFDAQEAGR